jgi:predicted transcriptional regulator
MTKRDKSLYIKFLQIFLIITVMGSLIILATLLKESSDSFSLDIKTQNFIESLIILAISSLSITLAITLVLSLNEYKQKFIHKRTISAGRSYLSMEDIFQNENRIKIVKEIINKPGIHHNELMRTCDLQSGQLQWHLDILLINQIIKKQTKGQYSLYFPNLKSFEEPLESKKGIIRNSSSHNVLEIIRNNPGITSSIIAKKTHLAKNTIKYHVDKLLELKLIYTKRVGRKKELYLLD